MAHRDPVNIAAALICNGRHFGRLVVGRGVVNRVLCTSMCTFWPSHVRVVTVLIGQGCAVV